MPLRGQQARTAHPAPTASHLPLGEQDRIGPVASGEEGTHDRRREVEGDVADDHVGPRRIAPRKRIGLHDRHPTIAPAAEPAMEFTTKRVGSAWVDLERGEWPAEPGELAGEGAASCAEFDDRALRGGDRRDDAGDDSAVDEEVLSELVSSAGGGR